MKILESKTEISNPNYTWKMKEHCGITYNYCYHNGVLIGGIPIGRDLAAASKVDTAYYVEWWKNAYARHGTKLSLSQLMEKLTEELISEHEKEINENYLF